MPPPETKSMLWGGLSEMPPQTPLYVALQSSEHVVHGRSDCWHLYSRVFKATTAEVAMLRGLRLCKSCFGLAAKPQKAPVKHVLSGTPVNLREAVLAALTSNGRMTSGDLRALLRVSRRYLYSTCRQLLVDGRIKRVPSLRDTRQAYFVVV
jgi:hypothetical protein